MVLEDETIIRHIWSLISIFLLAFLNLVSRLIMCFGCSCRSMLFLLNYCENSFFRVFDGVISLTGSGFGFIRYLGTNLHFKYLRKFTRQIIGLWIWGRSKKNYRNVWQDKILKKPVKRFGVFFRPSSDLKLNNRSNFLRVNFETVKNFPF